MSCTFTELIVDALDPVKLSEFWCAVLGWQPTGRYQGAVEISSPHRRLPTLVRALATHPAP